ncbi:MAG: glycosyltransferase family 2 protein [Lachnospiraceae bacterium]
MKKIIAVVVTYNRITLLKECVYALLHQKDCTDTQLDILLVDNASNDGTKEWIEEQIAHTESHDTTPIYALHLSVNTGGAGGFYHGMKWAYEHGADAIWIMDDDTIPKEDALQKLREGMARVRKQVAPKSEIGFVSSTVLWTDGSPCEMNRQHYVGDAFSISGKDAEENALALQPIDSATFVSLLFSREAVEKMGLPIKEYFIWGDDKEYTLRLSARYPCYHVKNSVVIHKMAINAGSNIVIDAIARVPRYFYAFRNDLCTAKRCGTKEVIIYFAAFFLNMLRVLLKSKDGKTLRLQTMWKGMRAGVKFDPEIEYLT